jgi:hypothetical protein
MKKISDEEERHREVLNKYDKDNRQRYNSLGSTRMTISTS